MWFYERCSGVTTDIGTVDATVGRLTARGQPLEVGEREFAGATHKVFVHAAATAVDVIQSLREHGDAELLVFNDRRATARTGSSPSPRPSRSARSWFQSTAGDPVKNWPLRSSTLKPPSWRPICREPKRPSTPWR